MTKNNISFAIFASALLLLTGCAKTASTDYGELSQKTFDAWISVNKQSLWTETELGSWIILLEDDASKPGVGSADDNPYLRLSYTVTDLDGNVTSTTDKTLSQQLGGSYWRSHYYYGPMMTYRGTSSMYAGLSEIIDGMHLGGHCKVVIPGWLLTSSRYDSRQDYLDAMSETSAACIYDFTIEEIISDTDKWELDILNAALAGETAKADSLAPGVYYICDKASDDPETEFKSGDEIYVNYICARMSDGQVVDTNIEREAKIAGVYSSSSTYEPLLINWADSASDLTMTSSESSMVTGFAEAIFAMRAHEKGRVFMTSDNAYPSGSGRAIPSFCPIVFTIEMVDAPNE